MERKVSENNPDIPRLTNATDAAILTKWAVVEKLNYGDAAWLMMSDYILMPVDDELIPELTNPLNFQQPGLTADEADTLNSRRTNGQDLWSRLVLGISDNAYVHKQFEYREGMKGDTTGIVGMAFATDNEIYAQLKDQAVIENKTVIELFSKVIRVYDLRRQPLDTAK